jgi:TetR/AcrR family transcriptional regulator
MRRQDAAAEETPATGVVRMRRRQRRAVDTRERILAAALAEFADRGFAGASTRAVAAAAGVQHPLVNYHFKSKEGLWRAVLAATVGHFMTQFNARLAGLRGVDDVTKLRLVQEDFIRFAAANPHFHLLMSQEARRSTKRLSWLVKEFVRPYFAEVTALIRSAQRAGCYVEGDPHHLQYLFIGATTRIFSLSAEVKLIAGASPFSAQMLERHVTACLGLFFRAPATAALEHATGRGPSLSNRTRK